MKVKLIGGNYEMHYDSFGCGHQNAVRVKEEIVEIPGDDMFEELHKMFGSLDDIAKRFGTDYCVMELV